MPGTLYLVATPIGNLEDLTLRALRVLREVDCIAAEDTRQTRKLLTHFEIATPMLSLHQRSSQSRLEQLVGKLEQGASVALVTDAGTPVISDPGAELVRRCVEAGVPVVPIPGPSAVLTALSASGFDGQAFSFVGFLPRKPGERRRALESLRSRNETLVFFESPERIASFLRQAAEVFGDRPAVVARELTKKFEEFSRGSLRSLAEQWSAREARGEFTIVIAGNREAETRASTPGALTAAVARYRELLAAGCDRRSALRTAAAETGVTRNALYEALLVVT